MAKYKTKSKVNGNAIITAIIAFIMAGVLAAGVCCLGFASRNTDGKWFGNFKNLSEWHWSDKTDEDKDNIDGDNKDPDDGGENNGNGGSILGEGENKGIRLLSAQIPREAYAANGISPQADSAYTFTASIEPPDATNKTVDYVVSFTNPNSEWASGKNPTDYFTVTQATDGALKATGTCLGAFGEQIKITVISRDNPEAKAECTVDYAKRISDVQVTMKKGGTAVSTVDFSADGYNYTWECTPVYGTGTVEDSFNYGYTLKTANALVDGVRANCTQTLNKDGTSTSYGWSTNDLNFTTSKNNLLSILKYTGGTTGAIGSKQKNDVTNSFLKYSGVVFELSITADGAYSSFTDTKTFNAGASSFEVGVTDIALGDNIVI